MKQWHAHSICCRPEVADDVISGFNEETFGGYNAANLCELLASVDFQKIVSNPEVHDLRPLGLGLRVGLRWVHSKARPWFPTSSILAHMVYFLPFFELFSWLQNGFHPTARPSDPGTMTNAALEAIASSSGNNKLTVESS